jgi:hypothetical protein
LGQQSDYSVVFLDPLSVMFNVANVRGVIVAALAIVALGI